jgi:hypothetical protein
MAVCEFGDESWGTKSDDNSSHGLKARWAKNGDNCFISELRTWATLHVYVQTQYLDVSSSEIIEKNLYKICILYSKSPFCCPTIHRQTRIPPWNHQVLFSSHVKTLVKRSQTIKLTLVSTFNYIAINCNQMVYTRTSIYLNCL